MTDSRAGAPALEPGALVPPYRVVRLVARGGMGEVYLARDTQLGRKVALKVIRASALGEPEAVKRFLLEARITARFSHPHIVAVYGAGEHEGLPYVAFEFLEGQSLRDRMDEQRLGTKEILRLGLAIAEALQEAHRNQVLHRDLKPENVFLPRDGRLRVVDFGLAVSRRLPDAVRDIAEGDPGAVELEASLSDSFARGGIVGTPLYMAPEQWKGLDSTEETDVWGLGMILYELLGGRPPYAETSNVGQFLKVCGPEPVPRLESIEAMPEGLEELVHRCLDKVATNRPGSGEVVRALHELLYPERGRLEGEESPFRGLLPFSERQADTFYGRDNEVAAFVERLRALPLLPVVGPSGAGKSSFVQAGVIPRLREQARWVVLRLRPGRHPFDTLAARLVRGDREGSTRSASAVDATQGSGLNGPAEAHSLERELSAQLMENPAVLSFRLQQLSEQEDAWVLLFVDQLEEVYTLVSDAEERRRFMEAVCSGADDPDTRVRVVLTLRDDFLVRLAETRRARAALEHVTVLRSPGADALREILSKPVQQAGYRYEDPSLIDRMVQAVGAEPAALPLIQVAAAELWAERDRLTRKLPTAAYEAMGGVEGALARQADGVLDGMTAEQVQVARELFVRLVTPEHTRQLVPREELLENLPEGGEEVLRRLVAGRAVVVRKARLRSGSGEVELVHESLVRNWGRLARWLEESREELAFLGEVGQAAALWDQRGRRLEEVWRGVALQEALIKAARTQVPQRVRDFLDAGERRERRWARRRRVVAAVAFAALAGVAAALALQSREAWMQRNVAEQQRVVAVERSEQAEVRRAEALREGASAALLRESMIEARAKLRMALEGQDSTPNRALWDELTSNPLRAETRLPSRVWTAKFLPDGRGIAALDVRGAVHVLDVETSGHRSVSRWNIGRVAEAAFSNDGGKLLSTGAGGEIRVWDLAHETVATLGTAPPKVNWFALSNDGATVASAHGDGAVHLWSVATGKRIRTLDNGGAGVVRLAFSPGGDRLVSGDLDGVVRLWDVASGRETAVLRGHDKLLSSVAFSPDGGTLATSGWDARINLWSARTGAIVHKLQAHAAPVYRARFSPDGKLLASVSGDKTVRLWRVADGMLLRTLLGHGDQVYDVDFSADGTRLLSLDGLGSLRVWSLATAVEPARMRRHSGSVFGLDIRADGKVIASASRDGTLRLWEVASGRVTAVLEGHGAGVLGVVFDGSGKRLVSGGNDHTVRVWDAERGVATVIMSGHQDAIVHPSLSPDGKVVASPSNDGTVRLWDAATGEKLRELRGHAAGVNQARFAPDGRSVATGADDGTIRIWDVASGRQTRLLEGHTAPVYGPVYDAAGRRLLSGGWDGTTRLWDLGTGASRVVAQCEGYAFFPAFHPTRNVAGVTCADGVAYLLDLDGAERIALRGHEGHVTGIVLSPDGKLAATSGDDGTVRLWEAETGRAAWRGVFLGGDPPETLTHEGWVRADGGLGARDVTGQWRAAMGERARLASIGEGGLLCMVTHDDTLEVWRTGEERRLASRPSPGVVRVIATQGGCLTLGREGEASYQSEGGEKVALRGHATAIAADGDGALVAADGRVVRYGVDGVAAGEWVVEGPVTALGGAGRWIVVGFAHGGLSLISVGAEAQAGDLSLVGLPSSPVERILEGPSQTLVAGFGNGLVGLWDLTTGTLVRSVVLHGRVAFLALFGDKLIAMTELGDRDVLDLAVLGGDYCALVREVWAQVPVVWEHGRAVKREPPSEHRCSKR